MPVCLQVESHFSEMKGDVGMSRHEKEKMLILRPKIIDNPIPTSLFMCYAAILLFVGTGDEILGLIGTLVNLYIEKLGLGLSIISCLGIGIFLFPFFS